VSKSGSPAPNPMMSLPSAFSLAARAVTARVGEGLIACTRLERSKIFPCWLKDGAHYTRAAERVDIAARTRGLRAGNTRPTSILASERHCQKNGSHRLDSVKLRRFFHFLNL
jgi:hypothetical protein